ncbi:MAG: sigma-70 family RNA polymerase sigma factor [Myxococcales bacterium]|nr:sigma-70 family RNA polymerase sigma factor [Myxococcales bacterium]
MTPDPDDADRALLAGCVAGDRRAWAGFVERFTRYVYYLVQLTGRRYDAALTDEEIGDLHNDVFVALLEDDRRRLRAFEGRNGCSVRSWIRLITIRKTVDALRRRRVHLSLDAEDRPEPVAETADPLDQLMAVADEARRGRLQELVAQLPAQDQLLLDMLYGQQLSVEAASAALRINRGALYTRKTRIIKKLRDLAATLEASA